jgi:hypothetical protein
LIDPEAYSQLQHALDILPAKPQLGKQPSSFHFGSLHLTFTQDALVEAFFSNINHHYNIIHPPTFIRQYINWSRKRPQGSCQDVQFTTLILMMCACVTQHVEVESKPTSGHNASSEDYHNAGQKLAAAIPAGFYHITNIQWKILSICWFKGEAKFTEAWHTIGLAVQEAYELGELTHLVYVITLTNCLFQAFINLELRGRLQTLRHRLVSKPGAYYTVGTGMSLILVLLNWLLLTSLGNYRRHWADHL